MAKSEAQVIVLVSCAGLKQRFAAPAKDLYTSPLFRASRAYAERVGDRWFILSAKHGLISPDTTIEPYNTTLTELKRRERETWAVRVWQTLIAKECARPGNRFLFLAGNLYRQNLEKFIHRAGCFVAVPMRGLGIGSQLQWLNQVNSR